MMAPNSRNKSKAKVTPKAKKKVAPKVVPVIPVKLPAVTPVKKPRRKANDNVHTEFHEFKGRVESELEAVKGRLVAIEAENVNADLSFNSEIGEEVSDTLFHLTETVTQLSEHFHELQGHVSAIDMSVTETIERLTSQRNAAILDNATLRAQLKKLRENPDALDFNL